MIRINLLPHREVKRAARQRQFNLLLGAVALLGIAIVILGYLALDARQQTQAKRNEYLKVEIAKLDKDIVDIKKLKEQTRSLLARKQAVETLQTNRSNEVHLLDQLVRLLPEGLYLKSIKQTGNTINLQGYAQSSARVSTLMRNLESSPWLESPVLIEIHAATVQGLRANEFNLNVQQKQPRDSADEQEKNGGKS
ncbi:pilus assembly protein PilN [Sulfuriferula plumbiphila]|uniref:Pilus assembly protein PilN n=1 Tax=Sulfuriferula plumbiphila TaxID=171865 RepID=A0A512L838_9PROT|nr:PilN domain-containing protein [Sulfuriferula plumbiphila]BBP05648.1 pilus assembly protein PilN [Sulfuriferula plumbiphila]GEP30645.1 pilus assembly protein PilN [Sulfuriferula plumbiphila]